MTRILALDQGWPTTREAEREALRMASDAGLPVITACTHFAADPPRVVVTVETSAHPSAALPTATGAVVDGLVDGHRTGRTGRVFAFPGAQEVPGELTLGALTAGTAVDRVVSLGGAEPGPDTVLRTQGFLRPELVAGELVLRVRPADGGAVVPFEQPSPTPCCADHD